MPGVYYSIREIHLLLISLSLSASPLSPVFLFQPVFRHLASAKAGEFKMVEHS